MPVSRYGEGYVMMSVYFNCKGQGNLVKISAHLILVNCSMGVFTYAKNCIYIVHAYTFLMRINLQMCFFPPIVKSIQDLGVPEYQTREEFLQCELQ